MKLFRMDEHDVYAARDIDEAKKFYLKNTGMDEKDAFCGGYPVEISPDEMRRYGMENEFERVVSVQKALEDLVAERAKFPCHFAVID
jgi:hypothetical protein